VVVEWLIVVPALIYSLPFFIDIIIYTIVGYFVVVLEGGGKVIHIAIFWDYVNLNPKPSTVQILPSGMHN
jgi:hypothetical protein